MANILDDIERRLEVIERLVAAIALPPEDKPLIDSTEAHLLLKVSLNELYKMVDRLEIPHSNIGGRLVFSRSELMAWKRLHKKK